MLLTLIFITFLSKTIENRTSYSLVYLSNKPYCRPTGRSSVASGIVISMHARYPRLPAQPVLAIYYTLTNSSITFTLTSISVCLSLTAPTQPQRNMIVLPGQASGIQ
jgi:hypothetical protein